MAYFSRLECTFTRTPESALIRRPGRTLKWKVFGNALLCATLLLAAGASHAANLARGDQRFLLQAAQAGLFEVAAGKLALAQSTNDDVKAYAQMMVDDHTDVGKALEALAASKGATLPTEPSRAQQSVLRQLQNSQRNRFDRAFVEKVAVTAHNDAVKLFTNAARNARDGDIKAFAEKNLPILQAHLEKGRALRTTVLNSHPAGWLGDHQPAPGSTPTPAPMPTTPSQKSPAAPVSPVSPASPTAPASVVPGK
ncbi:DUF4142 domain-containing protein [Bordetella sp. N]|uniref:DUF4142 domain-containing protein n=1 Tax=Bordetella sp. N TaxID=1746199 RepID=UPI000AA91BA9|nr:DUF4142 domain-containing protein [Bordetella sp. N]